MATIATQFSSQVNVEHNDRVESVVSKEKHIQKDGEHYTLFKKDIKEVYHELFDSAIKDYNAKQKRTDRLIDDYYEDIKKHKKKNVAYECIVGIYKKENDPPISKNTQIHILQEYTKWFIQEFQNLKVVGVYYHYDELGKDPHYHIDYIPFGTGFERGPKVQSSLSKALENMGFTNDGKKDTAQMKFERKCNDKLEELCNKFNIRVEHPHRKYYEINGKHIRHKDTHRYIYDKLKEAQDKTNELNKIIDEKKNEIKTLDKNYSLMDSVKNNWENFLLENKNKVAQSDLKGSQKHLESVKSIKNKMMGESIPDIVKPIKRANKGLSL